MPAKGPPEPWWSFFADLDSHLSYQVDLHCCGGFVATQLYGVPRTTNDIDFIVVVPNVRYELTSLAGKDSDLHRKHKVYLDSVTVNAYPDDYQTRLVPMFPDAAWSYLRIFALEAHDLALTKLERNIERDRDDVRYLAKAGHLKPDVLKERYHAELRPYLANEPRHDLTLRLWLESYW